MALVTDGEMLALGLSQPQIDVVRARVAAAVAIRQQIENYDAAVA